MRFYLGDNVLVFDDPSQYPGVSPLEKIQTIDRSADGSLHVEDFRTSIRGRELTFTNMSKADYEGLLNWFDNVANGAANSFYFEDEKGATNEVVISTNVYSFSETSYELYSGSLSLEYV